MEPDADISPMRWRHIGDVPAVINPMHGATATFMGWKLTPPICNLGEVSPHYRIIF